MMTSLNSLACKNKLVEQGFSHRQAAALANTVWDLTTNTLTTKGDFFALEQRIDLKFAKLKADLQIWVLRLMVVQAMIVIVMLNLLS